LTLVLRVVFQIFLFIDKGVKIAFALMMIRSQSVDGHLGLRFGGRHW
jgi:hypothetical protein